MPKVILGHVKIESDLTKVTRTVKGSASHSNQDPLFISQSRSQIGCGDFSVGHQSNEVIKRF